jgi:hypothetical protein
VARAVGKSALLTHVAGFAQSERFLDLHMSKQYNKVIKRKRRNAYLKRKKAAAKKTGKPAKK